MYLYSELKQRELNNNSIRVGLIGAGKFGSMFLSQVPTTPALVVTVIADLSPAAAMSRCRQVGWDDARISTTSFLDDAENLILRDDVDVVVEATGDPVAGIRHAMLCCEFGKHVVMVNVEADALAGPYLARNAQQAGVVYSMAYGDQPALAMEMIDWARSCGFRVVAAGKGTKYLPSYHESTPDTVWSHYGLTPEQAAIHFSMAQNPELKWPQLPMLQICRRLPTACSFHPAPPMTLSGYYAREMPVGNWKSTARLKSYPVWSGMAPRYHMIYAGVCIVYSKPPMITVQIVLHNTV
jgi:hypothetical protein